MWPWKKKKQPLPGTSDEELAAARKHFQSIVDHELKRGVPRQVIWNQLMAMKLKGLADLRARSEAERAILTVMVDRNLKGKDLEKQGKVDQAIPLYEANLVDHFIGTHPYERLRIIYTKRQDYQNAIRVCETRLAIETERHANQATRRTIIEQIEKLRAKAQ